MGDGELKIGNSESGVKNGGLNMGKRDLPERTFEFARRIVEMCKVLDQKPGVSRTLANQLLRSGTSVGANVEEGQAGQSRADFVSKLSIACKEARETHYWLRLLSATELVPESRLTGLLDEANQLVAILTTIIKKTKENQE
jgi:four helix bundle protein